MISARLVNISPPPFMVADRQNFLRPLGPKIEIGIFLVEHASVYHFGQCVTSNRAKDSGIRSDLSRFLQVLSVKSDK